MMNILTPWTVFALSLLLSTGQAQRGGRGNTNKGRGQAQRGGRGNANRGMDNVYFTDFTGMTTTTTGYFEEPGDIDQCGQNYIDPEKYVCCDGIPHRKSWQDKTECCGQYAFNPAMETCCDGLLNPGFGIRNRESACCGLFSYDRRCYKCEKEFIMPKFDYRHQICCDGKINELNADQTCCCGEKTIDPAFQICCDGVTKKRDKNVSVDCCNCGLTKVDIVVVLDASESITSQNWPKMLRFTTEILSEAEIDEDNVRVGVLTYRHNATVEFNLGDYHNKKKMFDAIESIPYVRGSTNTGLGIDIAREQMFIPLKGDRLDVDDVLIVVTDGDSDDFDYTVSQAEITRDAGIHIFAIGIALKNLTELKAIASPPVSQNVLSLSDFDHLESLKGKIFSSICTGTPIPNPFKKCGKNEYYNPKKELCCDGNPNAIITGEDTKCCGQNSFNEKTQICCNGVPSDLKGENTVCCGKVAMDSEKELCCGQSPVPRPSKAFDKCCGSYAYNPNTETCCRGFVSKAYGNPSKDTDCCGPVSYDTRCFKCARNKIKPLFDINCQICCDGSIHNLTSGDSCCCGDAIFSPSNGDICCDGKLRARRGAEKKHTCCECGGAVVDLAFVIDSSESVGAANWGVLINFVGAVISAADVNDGKTRVAVEVYRHNVTMEFKFNSYLRSSTMIDHVQDIPYVRGSTNTGLALEEMREKIFVPKAGDRPNVPDLAIVILDGTSDDPAETMRQAALAKEAGIHIYAIAVGIELNEEIQSIASEPWQENAFNVSSFHDLSALSDQLFDVLNDVCPQQPIPNRCKEPCGQKMYDPKTEVCCDGEPQFLHGGTFANTKCCGTESYGIKDEVCCNGVVNTRPGRRRNEPECCDVTAYDPKDSICCAGNFVVPKSGKRATDCCGMSSYNPVEELCCDGVIFENFGDDGKSGACCILAETNRTVSFDTRCYSCKKGQLEPLYDCAFERCCDGVIQKIDYQNSCCCGKTAFNIDEFICCDEKLSKRKPEDEPNCCECASSRADIIIVLDSSESVGLDNWRRMELFVEDLIAASPVPDTRFGLLTYKHNTSIEFNLNRYFDVASMLEAVDNLPYVRGSTNTGLALEVARKDMFIPESGDRPSVPNFLLLVTDGQSDEPQYTIEQARLIQDQDIHILALGVALKDVKELRAVASSPADDNAINLKSFDELEVVKQRIFRDLAKSVCPQRAKERCGLPCGDTVYDPMTQVCCNKVPQPIQGGSVKRTQCCAMQSYDVQTQACCGDKTVYDLSNQMCCIGTVNERPRGKNPQCCKDVAYDSNSAMCCYDKEVIPISGKGATSCCGMATYNPITELCCPDEAIYKNYGDDGKSGGCCLMAKTNRTVSYDKRCYKCVNGELEPLYDCAYQRCCDGVIQEIFSHTSCCCGKNAFDPDVKICCNGKLRDRKPTDDKKCCECASNIVDIVVVLDSSESVGEDNWRQMEVFVESLIEESKVPDVRFGLLTYRHNSSVEFRLNKYFDKQSLKEAVDNLPYVRGSTNTGLALQTMRQEMFTTKNGDRPIAPNFALLITDGQSDDPDYTRKQADLAKEQGIHIIALGVGLKDNEEIRAVASPPADENAVPVKDFGELKVVKERIFTDVAKSVCPQRPKPRCGTPCGNTTIDERYEICCKGVPHKRMAGDRTQCCGMVAYDPDCFICCEDDNLVSKYAGDFTECCCKWAYDSRSHVCCGNQILPKVAGKFTSCCHNETYDTRSQVCCDYMYVQPSYGEKNTECCNGESFDSRCYECKRNSIGPLYNENEELCCGGKIQKKEFDERSCCCGNKQFDADVGICCEDNYFDRPKGDEVTCCGPNIHNAKKEICCQEKVNPRLNGLDTKCCGQKSFHPSKHHCCEEKLNKKKSPGDTCCCADKVFDLTKKICCDGKVQKLAKPGNRSSSVCCGKKSFDPTKQICCANKVNKLLKNGASTACCGKKVYDPASHKCEDGKIVSVGKECNKKIFDPTSQMCCNGFINNGTFKDPWARCCFGDAYDAREKVCCCNGNLEDAIAGIFTQCCYSSAYDSRTHTCCDGQIVRKPYPSAECCCERQAYDSNREICCGGKVRPCGVEKIRCCGTEAYDPVLEICCDGKIHVRTYGEETYCCGEEAFTPTLAVCCGNKIAYNKKISMEW